MNDQFVLAHLDEGVVLTQELINTLWRLRMQGCFNIHITK